MNILTAAPKTSRFIAHRPRFDVFAHPSRLRRATFPEGKALNGYAKFRQGFLCIFALDNGLCRRLPSKNIVENRQRKPAFLYKNTQFLPNENVSNNFTYNI
ncbi:MAG: hypothetical protein IJ306_01230 [Oscillospiraceae bacterium]|nr:hypothetical protein [Oscillospiraceae bacterium]